MTRELTASDYARAEQMLAHNRARLVPGGKIAPQWLGDGTRFWYRIGSRFVLVDPNEGTRHDAFDHQALAVALSQASGKAVDATNLPFTELEFPRDETSSILFSAFGSRWEWSDGEKTCTRLDDAKHGPLDIPSPDGKWYAFRRDGNIWVRSRDGEDEFALTDDAEPHYEYGGLLDPMSVRMLLRKLGLPPAFSVIWSPDSTRLLVHRLDQRHVPEQVLVESTPADGGRPVEHRFHYAMPGDESPATLSWAVLDVASRTVVHQQDEPTPIVHAIAIVQAWWSGTKGEAVHFLSHSRDAKTLRLRRLDPETGETTTLISETGTTRVDPAVELGDPHMVRVLETSEILWWSQRDGFAHLYLYSPDGTEVTRVTEGPWLVRKLLWVDEDTRQVWFLALGLVDSDPYVRQICRVGLDGSGFTRITDDEHDHDVDTPTAATDPTGKRTAGGYFVDRASTPAMPPHSRVLDGDGEVVVELEAPGVTELEALGWTPPERFRATAADGKTPIYGLLWRPHNFDPAKSYPVIDHVYPGPQIYRAGPSFDAAHQGEPEAFAALGFCAVAIDGRGTAGRSKAFHDVSYGDLGYAAWLDDHVAAIRQLGHRHPWMDTDRVGITGQSAGGYATARAVLTHPEFYKVGVSTSGNHDNRINHAMWAEHYHGDADLVAISNATVAKDLQGKLLLMHGELDENVLVSHTLRVVDALIDADHDVDMLIVPGVEHAMVGRMHYVFRKTWDYFVRHLHGTVPPKYRLAPMPMPGSE